jgi:hypothetical protein
MPRYLKKRNDDRLWPWSDALAKRGDMIEVEAESVDAPVARILDPTDDDLEDQDQRQVVNVHAEAAKRAAQDAEKASKPGKKAAVPAKKIGAVKAEIADAVDPFTITDKKKLLKELKEGGFVKPASTGLKTLQKAVSDLRQGLPVK